MSLATRCPACGTTFRVVQDQLKISDGWVRCGQCQEVFNALETLTELPAAPVAAPPVPSNQATAPTFSPFTDIDLGEPASAAPAGERVDARPSTEAEQQPRQAQPDVDPDDRAASAPRPATDATVDSDDDRPWADAQTPPAASEAPASASLALTPAASVETDEAVSSSPASTEPASSPVDDAATPSPPIGLPAPDACRERKRRRRTRVPSTPATASAADLAPGDPAAAATPRGRRRKPEFMRRVERAAHWQRPAVRAVLGSATAVLLLLLGGQAAMAFRDELAARWPGLAPPLAQACQRLGCELAAPRALEHLVIDSSQLSRTAWPETLRLTAELRNTASHAVRTPALELRFTDPNGRTLVRKVLQPAELAASAPAAISADDTWHVDALLAVGSLKVSGFSAEVFYP